MDIIEKIKVRNKEYLNKTNEIYESLSDNIYPAMIEMLELVPDVEQYFKWVDIALQDEMIIFLAAVSYPVGYQMFFNGEDITITAENQEIFNKTVKLVIPCYLISASSTDIIKYLKSVQEQKNKLEASLEDAVELSEDMLMSEMYNDRTENDSFNEDKLSEEHKKALKQFDYLTSIKVKH